MLGKNRRLALLKIGRCSSQSISELIRTRVFEVYFVLIHVTIYVASTRTRIQRFVYNIPEAETDTYDRACYTWHLGGEPKRHFLCRPPGQRRDVVRPPRRGADLGTLHLGGRTRMPDAFGTRRSVRASWWWK